jgi:hypothetical protein
MSWSRCASEAVPEIGHITGERANIQAARPARGSIRSQLRSPPRFLSGRGVAWRRSRRRTRRCRDGRGRRSRVRVQSLAQDVLDDTEGVGVGGVDLLNAVLDRTPGRPDRVSPVRGRFPKCGDRPTAWSRTPGAPRPRGCPEHRSCSSRVARAASRLAGPQGSRRVVRVVGAHEVGAASRVIVIPARAVEIGRSARQRWPVLGTWPRRLRRAQRATRSRSR